MLIKILLYFCLIISLLLSSLIKDRRILEGESGYDQIISKLKDYEVHDFSTHEPTRRALISSGKEKKIVYEITLFGLYLKLKLERFDDLFASNYEHVLIGRDGNIQKRENRLDCIYRTAEGHGSISFCSNLIHATIFHFNETYIIQPLVYKSYSEHVIYRTRDLQVDPNKYCRVGEERDTTFRHKTQHLQKIEDADRRRLRRQQPPSEQRRLMVGNSKKIIGVGILNDNIRYLQKGEFTHLHSASLMANANILFAKIGKDISSTYTFKLQIHSMFTFAFEDPWTHDSLIDANETNVPFTGLNQVDANALLQATDFWRSKNLPNDVNGVDVVHLLSGYDFAFNEIGLARVDGLCENFVRAAVTQTASSSDAFISSTITHEIGHNLGALHTDVPPPSGLICTDTPTSSFIMSSRANGVPHTNWDSCSIEHFNTHFERRYGTDEGEFNWTSCVEDDGTFWDGSSICGDGIVSGEEECDCLNGVCGEFDPCCNGNNCTLKFEASCSAQDGCCIRETCQISPDTSKICRSAQSDCDFVEKCDGIHSKCPPDLFKATGSVCSAIEGEQDGGVCFAKLCKDRNIECTNRGFSFDNNWAIDCSDSCTVKCKSATGPCQQFQIPQNFEDGSKCGVGKGCFQGSCISFESIPIPNSANCSNKVIDNDETDVDCGGSICFGCIGGKLCLEDKDCLFPGSCNRTITYESDGNPGFGVCDPNGNAPYFPLSNLDQILLQVLIPILVLAGIVLVIACYVLRKRRENNRLNPNIEVKGLEFGQKQFENFQSSLNATSFPSDSLELSASNPAYDFNIDQENAKTILSSSNPKFSLT